MTPFIALIQKMQSFCKLLAVALAFAMMGIGQVANAEGNAPVTPAATSSPLTVHGIACVDQDLNGVCSFEEARVPNVLVRSVTDSATVGVTDNAGEYTLRAAPHSALEVTIPNGFRSVNGNLRKLHIQMDQSDQVDIALALDVPYSVTTPLTTTVAGQVQNDAFAPVLTVGGVALNPYSLILAILLAVLILLALVLLVLLKGGNRSEPRPVSHRGPALLEQPTAQLRAQEATLGAWQILAEQMVADALGETISIDESVGILEAKAEPNPRFSLVTRDGRTIIFTTDIRHLRKARFIRRGDKVVDISARSPADHAGAGALWRQVLVIRNMWHVTPPTKAHWYVVVRGKSVSKVQGQSISEMPFIRIPQITREGHG
jgi:hypothetical protein